MPNKQNVYSLSRTSLANLLKDIIKEYPGAYEPLYPILTKIRSYQILSTEDKDQINYWVEYIASV